MEEDLTVWMGSVPMEAAAHWAVEAVGWSVQVEEEEEGCFSHYL